MTTTISGSTGIVVPALSASGRLQVTGSTAPASGAGVELAYAAGTGAISAYDRTGSTYQELQVLGLSVDIRPSNTSTLLIEANKVSVVGTSTHLVLPAGSANNPAINFSTDTTSGLYRIGANNIGVAIGTAKILDIASTGLAIAGNVAIGGALNVAYGLNVVSSALSGAFQYGGVFSPVATSGATSSIVAVYAQPGTAAASFTCTNAIAVRVDDAPKGAGSTITNLYGLYIADLTAGGADNIGIRSLVAAGTGKFNLYISGTAPNYLAGELGVGIVSSSTSQLTLAASTTAKSSLRITHGAAPTTPVDGDVWSTTAGLFIRINGVTKTVTLT